MTGQGIEHFIRENHTRRGLRRQSVEPHHALSDRWRKLLDPHTLPIPQIRAHFENGVAFGQHIERRQRFENARRHSSGAGPELENGTASALQYLRRLTRYADAEEIGDLRGGREVSARADL